MGSTDFAKPLMTRLCCSVFVWAFEALQVKHSPVGMFQFR